MNDSEILNILKSTKNIAIIGLSDDPDRPSHRVAKYLQMQGYHIIPINPFCVNVLSEGCYQDLQSAKQSLPYGESIDIVDIFRKSELVLPHAQEAIKIGARVIWMQEGVEHNDAAELARSKGINVIMNMCLMKTHKRLFNKPQEIYN